MTIIPYSTKWEYWIKHFNNQVNKKGVRHTNRFDVTMQEWRNLFDGKCFCGKERKDFDRFQRRYCTRKHSILWQLKTLDWNSFRYVIFKRDNYSCKVCKIYLRVKKGYRWIELTFDVVHIVAISLGGMCFEETNARTLCPKCHKVKTKEDMRKLRLKKKQLIPLDNF